MQLEKFKHDTIVAPVTAKGRSGVAVIRISGKKVNAISLALLGCLPAPREASFLSFLDEKGDAIDEGIAIFFPQPHSFTGEDVLELQGHGSPVVITLLINRILHLGARLARPGEFSERAFLNGKIDLTQAEAIADLIDSASHEAARSAIRSLQGVFKKEIETLKQHMIDVRMYVEAALDFSEEEIDFLSDHHLLQRLKTIEQHMILLHSQAKQGSLLREGLTIVIAGKPNVGKSSLLNYLSGKSIAIVTDIPGTTRDVLHDHILIDGMPLHVIDTAGLRESNDEVEQEGIKRAYQAMQDADMVLYMIDASQSSDIDLNAMPKAMLTKPIILVRNKIDLLHENPAIVKEDTQTTISISIKHELGIDLLKNAIKQQAGFQHQTEGVFLARSRHLDALKRAKVHIDAGLSQWSSTPSLELLAEELRCAHRILCEITGEFTADDLLGHIFSTFCIGK